MQRQLVLIEVDEPEWQLDEETRAIGRRGVAEVRAALVAARVQRAQRDEARGERSPGEAA